MALQQPISLRNNQKQIGKIAQVLIEQENPSTGQLIGRSARFSPDVDGLVYIQPNPKANPKDAQPASARLGTMALVQITDADPYDLYGHLVTAQNLFNTPEAAAV
jgi:ribosomal protein S12 methylthiotransferase